MNDPIVDEIRRIRDAHAAVFNCDLDAIFKDIKDEEKKSGLKFVSYPPRRTEPNNALQPIGTAIEALANEGHDPVLTEELKGLLDRRQAALDGDPKGVLTWDEITSHARRSR